MIDGVLEEVAQGGRGRGVADCCGCQTSAQIGRALTSELRLLVIGSDRASQRIHVGVSLRSRGNPSAASAAPKPTGLTRTCSPSQLLHFGERLFTLLQAKC